MMMRDEGHDRNTGVVMTGSRDGAQGFPAVDPKPQHRIARRKTHHQNTAWRVHAGVPRRAKKGIGRGKIPVVGTVPGVSSRRTPNRRPRVQGGNLLGSLANSLNDGQIVESSSGNLSQQRHGFEGRLLGETIFQETFELTHRLAGFSSAGPHNSGRHYRCSAAGHQQNHPPEHEKHTIGQRKEKCGLPIG